MIRYGALQINNFCQSVYNWYSYIMNLGSFIYEYL